MENSQIVRALSGMVGALLVIFTALACGNSRDIVVHGDLRGANTFLEGKTLYLGNAETRNFEDTAVVKGGKFEFKIKTGGDFIPFRTAIVFETGNPEFPHQVVGYKNPYSKKIDEPNFYAEPGMMKLTLDTIRIFTPKNKVVTFNIDKVNRQTSVLFRHYTFKGSSKNAADNHAYNRSLVQKHPYSLELLRTLNFNKSALATDEAKHLLALFDPELHSNPGYIALKAYLDYDNKTGSDFPKELALKTADDKSVKEVLVDSSKHNLIVFWASWCGPCRMEIPQIKKLYENEGQKLNVVSISVDKDQNAWKKAMHKEQMPWKQFLLPLGDTYAILDKKYNLQTIPIWVLLDGSGKVVDQHVGYEPGENAMDLKVAALLK
ncbi:thiol:disulfide interchange protein [Dyadobacter endophyticus]|uniref:Thiol:disulfide interchange protein n=1 Tax=Dyadobacter endophyticus TaxID=1749036 RepID=A0ABQ1ZB14_9BACT|nr:TlpA disulfide reductase family protein [Dyadobacter endophyticus]GGH54047.1 thiol:disulfide interchange protein [Dyadobacter endophyticus]